MSFCPFEAMHLVCRLGGTAASTSPGYRRIRTSVGCSLIPAGRGVCRGALLPPRETRAGRREELWGAAVRAPGRRAWRRACWVQPRWCGRLSSAQPEARGERHSLPLSGNAGRPPAASCAMEPLLPRERRRAETPATSEAERWVTLHIFVRGAGPKWEQRHRLGGWDSDRLDVRALLAAHKLKALYAFSSSEQRGMQILANPRNGLSLAPYSAKAGSVIRLDAEPQATLLESVKPWVGSALLTLALASGLLAARGHTLFIPAGWSPALAQLNEAPTWPLFALGVLLFTVLFWNRLTRFYR